MGKPKKIEQSKKEHSFDSDLKNNLRRKTKQGIIWTIFFNNVQFLFRFAGSIILARLLFPEDFGLMAIVSVVIQLAHRLTNFGFTMVLVQRKEVKREHFDTVFFTNLFLILFIMIIIFFSSPWITEYFDNKNLEPLVKVIAFNLLLLSISSVPRAVLRREMKFRELELSNTISEFVTVLSPICFAFAGYGVWSLVIGTLLGSVAAVVALTFYSRFIPKIKFHFWALKDVFSFGLWVYIGSYVKFAINKIDFVIVGKILNVTQLGFYERAFNLMSLPRKKIGRRINSVLFSAYSKIQDEDERLVKAMLQIVSYISLIVCPLMVWIFFVSPSLINVLYGAKWLAVVYPFKVMCVAAISNAMTQIFEPILLAKGLVVNRTRRDFNYLIILGISVYIGTRWGINGVAWGTSIASIFQLGLTLHLLVQKLPFTVRDFIKVQKSSIIYSSIQILGLYLFQYFSRSYIPIESWKMLICGSFLSGIILIGSHLTIRFKDIDAISEELFLELKKLSGLSKKNRNYD